jgi:hypothetical protein
MVVGLTLVQKARVAGLRLAVADGRLVVHGPRRSEPVARELLAHKADVLAVLVELSDPDARAALLWWYRQGHPEIADEEQTVLRRLDTLGAVPDVRTDLARLVERVCELRDAYWRDRGWGTA